MLTGDFDPVPYAHLTTTTTHKSLRGPRGGMVLCGDELAQYVDRGCPAVLGGPLSHIMAAKAVALAEAATPEFRDYAQRIVDNARALADGLLRRGVSAGHRRHRQPHRAAGRVGVRADRAAGRVGAARSPGIVTNRNSIPRDPNGAWFTSGIRIGHPGADHPRARAPARWT